MAKGNLGDLRGTGDSETVTSTSWRGFHSLGSALTRDHPTETSLMILIYSLPKE